MYIQLDMVHGTYVYICDFLRIDPVPKYIVPNIELLLNRTVQQQDPAIPSPSLSVGSPVQ